MQFAHNGFYKGSSPFDLNFYYRATVSGLFTLNFNKVKDRGLNPLGTLNK